MRPMATTDPATALLYGLILGASPLIIALMILFAPLTQNPGALFLASLLLTAIFSISYYGLVVYLQGYAMIPGYVLWIGLAVIALFATLFIRASAKRGVVVLFIITAISLITGILGSIGLQALSWGMIEQYLLFFIGSGVFLFLLLTTLVQTISRR